MVKYFRLPFGVSGDRLAIPDPTQAGGQVSYNQGFGPDYELDPGSDPAALVIPRDQFNELIYDITEAIQQYQQFSVPDFITSVMNDGSPFSYSIYARVRFDAGGGLAVYESLVGSNTSDPTDATKWAQVPSPGGSGIPAGAILDFGGTTAPTGFLLCYGQAVSRSTYSNLFGAIGTNYGVGDGTTTFNLPDYRGRTGVGLDNMGGSAANRITNGVAGFVGTQIGAAGGDQALQAHTHTVNDSGHTHTVPLQEVTGFAASGGGSKFVTSANTTTSNSTTGVANASTGAGGGQNVQPSIVVTKIIKT